MIKKQKTINVVLVMCVVRVLVCVYMRVFDQSVSFFLSFFVISSCLRIYCRILSHDCA